MTQPTASKQLQFGCNGQKERSLLQSMWRRLSHILQIHRSWIGEAPATDVTELQSENTESANGAEEVNEPEESLLTDGTEVAYGVDDGPTRTRPKRETRPHAHLKNYMPLVRRETD